jgi:hypothetical protein
MNAETSQDANGLVLDAWLTEVVVYGPAEATATGRRIISAQTAAAARGKDFLMPHLHRIEPKSPAPILPRRASRCQARTHGGVPTRQIGPIRLRQLAQSHELVLPKDIRRPPLGRTNVLG